MYRFLVVIKGLNLPTQAFYKQMDHRWPPTKDKSFTTERSSFAYAPMRV